MLEKPSTTSFLGWRKKIPENFFFVFFNNFSLFVISILCLKKQPFLKISVRQALNHALSWITSYRRLKEKTEHHLFLWQNESLCWCCRYDNWQVHHQEQNQKVDNECPCLHARHCLHKCTHSFQGNQTWHSYFWFHLAVRMLLVNAYITRRLANPVGLQQTNKNAQSF